jgi:hypothetical protein
MSETNICLTFGMFKEEIQPAEDDSGSNPSDCNDDRNKIISDSVFSPRSGGLFPISSLKAVT